MFKVGDMVNLKPCNEILSGVTNLYWQEDMEDYVGKQAFVTHRYDDGVVNLDIDNGRFLYHPEMLELVEVETIESKDKTKKPIPLPSLDKIKVCERIIKQREDTIETLKDEKAHLIEDYENKINELETENEELKDRIDELENSLETVIDELEASGDYVNLKDKYNKLVCKYNELLEGMMEDFID